MSDQEKSLTVIHKDENAVKSEVTRRRFLAEAGGALAIGTAAVLGVPATGMGKKAKIEFIQSSYGEEENTGNKVLVAYASRCGSTGGIADAIGKELCALGAAADVRLVKEVADLSSYKAVVIGSAIRAFRWLPEASDFVYKNKETLSHLPVAYFLACLQVIPEQPTIGRAPKNETMEQRRQRVRSYLDQVLGKASEVKPIDIGLFAGAVDYSKLMRGAKALGEKINLIEGDFRDFEKIRTWARTIAPALLET